MNILAEIGRILIEAEIERAKNAAALTDSEAHSAAAEHTTPKTAQFVESTTRRAAGQKGKGVRNEQ